MPAEGRLARDQGGPLVAGADEEKDGLRAPARGHAGDAHYDSILQLTGWLSPPAAAWCRARSRFEHVYPAERVVLKTDNAEKDF
ncbi:hypothetical protein Maq22A_1p34730 (plasmid) [Methylobacterium aquaticum]|uniref:Uncharacterized protein n=1 Tax=Methylobacterium aquaticum TaxID=270351 RepID=A0A0C6G0G0_9HYPH|nr:hypothetical protein Maq22A_1p34730 [Methylobacterium aquaticum]